MRPRGRAFRVVAVCAAALLVAFTALELEARGRGGGGRGGGGRSISRGGAASHGSMRSPSGSMGTRGGYSGGYSRQAGRTSPGARPALGPATQPARPGALPSTRPGASPARPGTLESRGPGTLPAGQRPGEGPGSETRPGEDRPGRGDSEGNREDWQQHRDESREDWQQHLEDQQQDRQQYANRVREDIEEEGGYWGGGVWVGDWDEMHVISYDDDEEHDWALLIAGWAIGTAITASTFQAATTSSTCALEELAVGGVTYFRCGSTWYSRVMQSGEVRYIVVAPPPGY